MAKGKVHGRKKVIKRKSLEEMSHKQLQAVADRDFSKFIRLRDSDEDGYCTCCTCGKTQFWKEVDNGHFVKRNIEVTRYDEKNCNAQCRACNNYGKGEEQLHKEYIDNKYGEDTASNLRSKKNKILIRKKYDYIALIHLYRMKWKELLKLKGLK